MNNINGLNNEEVLKYRKLYGKNTFTKKKKVTLLSLIIESFSDPIVKILLIALSIKIILITNVTDIYETLGIAISVFLASFISVLSEYGSEKAFEKLSEENNSINVKIIRNKTKQLINIEEIVINDILILESGDKVPADAIILEGNLSLDESMLTGESKEKIKYLNDTIYMGTIVTNGSSKCRVTNIGDNTYYGHIASNIQEEKTDSPLKLRLRNLAKIISIFGYIGAFLVFISYMLNAVIIPENYSNIYSDLLYALTLSVSVVVMAVPEGLPMMITLVLSSNMKRLLKKNVLVRKLIGIETSGSLNILFTDKTGTLTEGKLKVNEIYDSNLNAISTINELFYISLIYNNSSFLIDNIPNGSNTTDRAILEYINCDKKGKYKIISKQDFNSKNKYSSVTVNYNGIKTFYKGAYELLINKCSRYLDNNIERVLLNKDNINNFIKDKTMSGLRVLALAYGKDNLNDLVLVGFVFLKDNIRKEAYESIKLIKNSGIQVVMLTGDSIDTAISISKELKIINSSNDIILTSEEFNKMKDEEVSNKLSNIKVIARCLPEDKNRLVKIAKSNNLVVGMTGDGINDASALKQADVGYSMGSGSEIAKYSSDIIILDNNISSICSSILYGRTIFKNIRKFVTFQLCINFCTVILSIVGPFIGFLSPITIIQVLWVNMVMDTFSGLAFSYEPALLEYMNELPKKKDEKIINKYMLNQIIFDGLYSTILCIFFLKSNIIRTIYNYQISDKFLLTAFFGLFIFLDIFTSFNTRTNRINILSNILKNKIFLIIFLFITIVQIILIYFGGTLFRTTGLSLYHFIIMILISFSIIPFDMLRKFTLKKRKKIRHF